MVDSSIELKGVKYQIFAIDLSDNEAIDTLIENLLKVKENNKTTKLKDILKIDDEAKKERLFKEHIKKLGLDNVSLDF